MAEALSPAPPPLRRGSAVAALAQQELAARLDHRLAVIGHDIGGGVGLGPGSRQIGAGADDIDRRTGPRHHAVFGWDEARAGDDPRPREASLVERPADMP